MATRGKTTLKDIAAKAHVSTALVSCILNGKGRASEEVRTRVLSLLEEAGYRPKYTRRSFFYLIDLERITQSGKTIPVMHTLKGVEQALEEEGIQLQVEFIATRNGRSGRSITQQFEMVAASQPGAVFVPTDETWRERACSMFNKAGIPVMQLGYDTESPRYPAVVVDSFAGAYTATQYLLQKGHTRIGTLRWTYALAGVNSTKKYAGYRAALADAGIDVRREYVKAIEVGQDDPEWRPSREYVEELLALPDPPTAIFVENSCICLSLLYPLPSDSGVLPKALHKVDMVHFEDWPLDPVEDIVAKKLPYPCRRATLLTIDWEGIGRYAARALIDRVRGIATPSARTVRIAPILQKINGFRRESV